MRATLVDRRLIRVALRLLVASASCVGCTAAAQSVRAAPAAVLQQAARDTAPAGAAVVLGVDTLFSLYGSLGPFTPESRATSASARFHDMAAALAGGDSSVVTDRDSFSELSTAGVVLMTVLDADAAPTGTARPALARQYAARARTRGIGPTRSPSRSAVTASSASRSRTGRRFRLRDG